MDQNTESYEAPSITDIGTLHELTLDMEKDFAPTSDGFSFQGHPINGS